MEKIFKKTEEFNLDAIFVSKIENVRYLTNFTGEEGFAVVVPPEIYLFVDSRFTEQANKEVSKNVKVIEYAGDIASNVKNVLLKHKVHFLGVEEYKINLYTYRALKNLGFLVIVPLTNFVEEIRMIKTSEELEKIRKACSISTSAFLDTIKLLKPGITEIDIASELEYRFKKYGGEKPSFTTIVASGERGSLPHGVASLNTIKEHVPIVFDFGVFFQGFASDTTRVVSIGDVDSEVKKAYSVIESAQKLGREKAKAGLKASELDKLVRDYIANNGLGEYFKHGLGHGVGLEIHELPYVNATSPYILQENMVITIEPGVYFEGRFGLRLEDTVIIKEDSIENLIDLPHSIIVV